MRIAFSGASGTGKTTLATWIAEKYGIPLNPVGARSVAAEMGFSSPYEADAAGKRSEFQQRLLVRKLEWEAEHESFVTDRTPFDNVAYTALHSVSSVDERMLKDAIAGSHAYTFIFMCPLSGFWHVGDDVVRLKDRTYHELFEVMTFGLIRRHVSDFYIGRYVLKCTTVNARRIEIGNLLLLPRRE
jgi:predicted ATPase